MIIVIIYAMMATQETITKEIKGSNVPVLGFGTWQLNDKECEKAVSYALEVGYRHIDTAQAYGNEEFVGKAINSSGVDREEIFLTTKSHYQHLAADDLIQRFENSLTKLQTDYVDLLLIHWPAADGTPLEETLDAMIQLGAERKARHIGVSNFTPEQLREAEEHAEIFCNQVEYHPFIDQSELLKIAKKKDMLFTAYSPLARGEITDNNDINVIAKKHGKTTSQITLRWLIQQPKIAAIPKSASNEHIEENFNIFDFKLDDDDMKRINDQDKTMRIIDPDHAPDW